MVAGGIWWSQEPSAESGATRADGQSSGIIATDAVAELPEAAAAPVQPGDPQRLELPALGVSAPISPIRTVDTTLVPPSDPQQLGWWADGARPGAPRGSALVTGHTVQSGGGALDDLEALAEGDRVVVRSARSRTAYVVRSVETLGKGEVTERRRELFTQRGPGRLVLITCEDWDGETYLSNVVVTAEPAGAGPRE